MRVYLEDLMAAMDWSSDDSFLKKMHQKNGCVKLAIYGSYREGRRTVRSLVRLHPRSMPASLFELRLVGGTLLMEMFATRVISSSCRETTTLRDVDSGATTTPNSLTKEIL